MSKGNVSRWFLVQPSNKGDVHGDNMSFSESQLSREGSI